MDDPQFDQDHIYEREIMPIIDSAAQKCKLLGIPMIAVFCTGMKGYAVHLRTTTTGRDGWAPSCFHAILDVIHDDKPHGDMWVAFGLNPDTKRFGILAVGETEDDTQAAADSSSEKYDVPEVKLFNIGPDPTVAAEETAQWMMSHGLSRAKAKEAMAAVSVRLLELVADHKPRKIGAWAAGVIDGRTVTAVAIGTCREQVEARALQAGFPDADILDLSGGEAKDAAEKILWWLADHGFTRVEAKPVALDFGKQMATLALKAS
jgi:hypothetical protein